MKLAVIDLGMGNLESLLSTLMRTEFVGVIHRVCDHRQVQEYDFLILPGVGNFEYFSNSLSSKGFTGAIDSFIDSGKNFLGICSGMQILCRSSEESPGTKGLGFFDADVVSLHNFTSLFENRPRHRLPLIGQCEHSRVLQRDDILGSNENDRRYYLNHSFGVGACEDAALVGGLLGYDYALALARMNVWGVQFHPEMSSDSGLNFLNRWLGQV